MDPENFKIYRERNLYELKRKVNGIRLFNRIIEAYEIHEKAEKISNIILDEEKKNAYKVIETASETGKIVCKKYFVKKYFMKTLRYTQKGAKKFKEIYKSSEVIKKVKICGKVGTVGTGVVITLLADVVIEGACDLVAKGLEKTYDYLENKISEK